MEDAAKEAAKTRAIVKIVTRGIIAAAKPRMKVRIHNAIRDEAQEAKASPHRIKGDGIDAEAGSWVEEELARWMG